jgi:hypothetical protein
MDNWGSVTENKDTGLGSSSDLVSGMIGVDKIVGRHGLASRLRHVGRHRLFGILIKIRPVVFCKMILADVGIGWVQIDPPLPVVLEVHKYVINLVKMTFPGKREVTPQ